MQIDLLADRALVRVKDGAVSLGRRAPYMTEKTIKTFGAARVETVKFVLDESGFIFTFELEFWEDIGVNLSNTRTLRSSGKTWEQSGWCIAG